MKFSLARRALLASVFAIAVSGVAYASPDNPVIGVVVKIGGIPWFNAMDAGDELGVVHPEGHNLIVNELVDLNKDTVDDLAKMGL